MKNFTKQATALMLSGAMVFGSLTTFANNNPKNKTPLKTLFFQKNKVFKGF